MTCCRFDNESYEDSNIEIPNVDFERPVNQAEEEENEDGELSPDLLRMVD